MNVVIDGVKYVPAGEVPPLPEDKSVEVARIAMEGIYFGETHKAMGKLWRILRVVAPDLAEVAEQDPAAAYHRLNPEPE